MGYENRFTANKYSSTPRKVFDKHVDRMETKRQRDREDHRADMQALLRRVQNIEVMLTQLSLLQEELQEHFDGHLDDTRDS